MFRLGKAKEKDIKSLPVKKMPKHGREQHTCYVSKKHHSPHVQTISPVSPDFYIIGFIENTSDVCHGVVLLCYQGFEKLSF